MIKCAKVFLIFFVVTFPIAGLLRTSYLTRTIGRHSAEMAASHNVAHPMAEAQTLEEPAAVSAHHNHLESGGG